MTGHSRYASSHAGSSAFSASANANEDWTKISDLAERRRIQNRIAQRNYRKKLKRRLEDLERRAGSSSASPEQQHSELATTSPSAKSSISSNSSGAGSSTDSSGSTGSGTSNSSKARRTSPTVLKSIESPESQQQLSPELLPLDDHEHGLYEPPSLSSLSSRPLSPLSRTDGGLTYSTYPSTSTHLQQEYHSSYHHHQPQQEQQQQQNYFNAYQNPTDYSQSLPPTLPTMLPSAYMGGKQESPLFGAVGGCEEEMMNPFSMNYAHLAGLEVPTAAQSYGLYSAGSCYPHHSAHVNATDSFSRSGSPALEH